MKPRVIRTPTWRDRRPRRRKTRSRGSSWHDLIRRDATFWTPAREMRTTSSGPRSFLISLFAEAHAPRAVDVCKQLIKAVIFERVRENEAYDRF